MRISSKKARKNFLRNSSKMWFMRAWKVDGALIGSKDIDVNLNTRDKRKGHLPRRLRRQLGKSGKEDSSPEGTYHPSSRQRLPKSLQFDHPDFGSLMSSNLNLQAPARIGPRKEESAWPYLVLVWKEHGRDKRGMPPARAGESPN